MIFLRQSVHLLCQAVKRRFRQWTKPNNHTLILNIALDLARSKSELVLENAFLRQQLIVLQRQAVRPNLTWRGRALFVLLATGCERGKRRWSSCSRIRSYVGTVICFGGCGSVGPDPSESEVGRH